MFISTYVPNLTRSSVTAIRHKATTINNALRSDELRVNVLSPDDDIFGPKHVAEGIINI
jgi:hypothetical protein